MNQLKKPKQVLKNHKVIAVFCLGLAGILLSLTGCKEETISYPRPYAYPRINLPEHSYSSYSSPTCDFSFEYPAFGEVEQQKSMDSCIADIYYPPFDCKWHLTYRNIPESGKTRSQHFEEYRKLVYKHSPKITKIDEFDLKTPNGTGTMFELYGNVGTPAKIFFGNDEHLVMMSFYFNTAEKNDSLAPVIAFMKQDMEHMVTSLNWRD